MKNNWIRFLAGMIASAVLVGAFALTGGMKSGKRTDGLMYQASGLHPDGELMSINGQVVSCEEYLYRLAQDCEYLAGQVEGLDWNAAVTEGMTFAEYAKADAAEAVKQHAVVRAWAQEAGITLTDGRGQGGDGGPEEAVCDVLRQRGGVPPAARAGGHQ